MAKSDINKIDMALCTVSFADVGEPMCVRALSYFSYSLVYSFIFKGAKLDVIYGLLKY